MNRQLMIAGLVLFSLPTLAQDALQGVNRDVLNGLIFNGRPELKMAVTRTLPANMAGLRVPAGFTLIGTGVRGDGRRQSTSVAMKTTLPADRAFAALVEAQRAEGFQIEPSPIPQTFNVAGGRQNATVCRNGERRTLLLDDADGVRYAGVLLNPDTRKLACNAQDPRASMMGFEIMRRQTPRFSFPASARLAGGPGGGGSGSNDSYSTSTTIQSPDTAGSLAEHLAAQMPAQGWRRDASWAGSMSAGSTWRREADELSLWGTLEVVSLGEGTIEVGFLLQSR